MPDKCQLDFELERAKQRSYTNIGYVSVVIQLIDDHFGISLQRHEMDPKQLENSLNTCFQPAYQIFASFCAGVRLL
jgi:hypothetical protein